MMKEKEKRFKAHQVLKGPLDKEKNDVVFATTAHGASVTTDANAAIATNADDVFVSTCLWRVEYW